LVWKDKKRDGKKIKGRRKTDKGKTGKEVNKEAKANRPALALWRAVENMI